LTRFEMRANYVDVLEPRKQGEDTILRFRSGHGVYADISLTANTLTELRDKLEAED